MIIEFPGAPSPKIKEASRSLYYRTHYKYIFNILSYCEHQIKIVEGSTSRLDVQHVNHFFISIDGKRVVIDYSDHLGVLEEELNKNTPYFKFHATEDLIKRGVLPLPPMSFINWNDYNKYTKLINYNHTAGKIFYKNNPYGAAVDRRNKVKQILTTNISKNILSTDIVDQHQYWGSFNNCRINVVVPGARPDILDRTHMQSFALGIPVITPNLTTLLPYGEKFIAGQDYIQCDYDYNDLVKNINDSFHDYKMLQYISKNCKEKFLKLCTPHNICKWIESNI